MEPSVRAVVRAVAALAVLLSTEPLPSRAAAEPKALEIGAPAVASADVEGSPAAPAGAVTDGEGESAVVALWSGGTLRRADLESWLAFSRMEESQQAIEESVYLLAMAALSEARGDHLLPEVRLEMEVARHKTLLPRVYDRILADVRVSDEEVEAERLKNPEVYDQPRRVLLYNVYGGFTDEASKPAVRERMERIHRKLEEGADFEDVAREESESSTRFRGGRLGLVDPEQLPGPIADAVRRLGPGELTAPVEHGTGVSIFLCREVRDAVTPSVDSVRARIRKRLLEEATRKARAEFQRSLLESASVRIDPDSDATVLRADLYSMDRGEFESMVALRYPHVDLARADSNAKREILEAWVGEVLASRRAVEWKIDEDPEVVNSLRWLRVGTLARRELVRRVDARIVEPTDEEVREAFEQDSDRFKGGVEYRLRAIEIEPGGEKKLMDLVRRIDDGDLTFDEAARRYSVHGSASEGGRLGWLSRRDVASYGSLLVAALKELEPGRNTGPLRLPSGLWIFQLEGRREGTAATFEDVRSQVAARLRGEQVRRLEVEVRRELLESIGLAIET